MPDEIISLVKQLNKQDVIVTTSFRRNSIYYPFVSYINHTIALFISENYGDLALLIKRSYRELSKLKTQGLGKEDYFRLCENYLILLSKYMIQNKLLLDEEIEYFLSEIRQDNLYNSI